MRRHSRRIYARGRDKKRARFFYEKERVRMIEADGWSNNYNRFFESKGVPVARLSRLVAMPNEKEWVKEKIEAKLKRKPVDP